MIVTSIFGGGDKHFGGFDKHLARIFVVSTHISAPPSHTPAPCSVEYQSIENRVPKDLGREPRGNPF